MLEAEQLRLGDSGDGSGPWARIEEAELADELAGADHGANVALSVRTSDPLPPWAPSTVTLLGDAAHTMTPGRGAGANTALRDARELRDRLVRVRDGESSLLFGPFATFSPKFLKNGSLLDIVAQVRPGNIWTMLKVAIDNPSLITYLVGELLKGHHQKMDSLREFMPSAKDEDWELLQAGQRAQVMKKDPEKGGVLQFGTEVVTHGDGSLGALLGASPGASTAAPIMLTLLERCFPAKIEGWKPALDALVPSYGRKLNDDRALLDEVRSTTDSALQLS